MKRDGLDDRGSPYVRNARQRCDRLPDEDRRDCLARMTGSPEGILMDIIAGIGGAFVGGLLLGPLVGAGPVNSGDLSTAGLAVSLLGALVLLAILNLVRRGSAR
jgi:uncharacterized membrane protein YeaQ/YmgE (transglycosylase-associated protein family)